MAESSTSGKNPRSRPALRFQTGEDVLSHRKKLGFTQSDFWNRISVTQSRGSRYECGRNIPKPVQLLLHLAYGTEKQARDLLVRLRPEKP